MVAQESVRITVRVQPNASQNELLHFRDGVLQIKITAPPVKGKANRELIKFLSDTLQVSQSQLTVEQGMTSKRKVISIDGLTRRQIMGQLGKLGI